MWNPITIMQLITLALGAAASVEKLVRGKGKGKQKKAEAVKLVTTGLAAAQAAGAPITKDQLGQAAPLIDSAVESAVSLWNAIGWPAAKTPPADG
jgi:hypothetical protein